MSQELRDKEAADHLEGLLEGFVAYEAQSAGEGKGAEFVVSLPALTAQGEAVR